MIDFRVYLITDRRRIRKELIKAVEEALSGGIRAVQLREKDMPVRERLRLAYAMKKLTEKYGAKLFINDRVDIALSVGAEGVHLGRESIPPYAVKRIKESLLVGYSAHSVEEALEAQKEGADFVTYSPVFETSSKPGAKAKGVDELKRAVEALSIPVFALGGVTYEKLNDLRNTGAHGIAVVTAILGSDNIKKEAERFVRYYHDEN